MAWVLLLASCCQVHASSSLRHAVGNMSFTLSETQTIETLTVPAVDLADGCFDFLPNAKTFRGSHKLGDVSMRVRVVGTNSSYTTLTTGGPTANKAAALPTPPGELAAADLSATLATPPALSLGLERHYVLAPDGHGLQMRFELRNRGAAAVEVGAWGAAMVFDTMATEGGGQRTLVDLAGNCSMVDPAISGEGGWVSVTRMTGTGGVLLVVPEGGVGVEAYREMHEASGGQAFELLSLSKAWADDEWAHARGPQWVAPTSRLLAPGEVAAFTYRLLLAPSVRDKDAALAAAGFAVVQAVPSWTIATDMRNATLHVLPPKGTRILAVRVTPTTSIAPGTPRTIGRRGFFAVPLQGRVPGRASVQVSFSDGSTHVSSLHVLPPLDIQLARYGRFCSETAWYANTSDPFGRGNSVLGWNRELNMHIGVPPEQNGYEDNRIFNNGLSDEAGAGANVGFGAKVSGAPVQAEVSKLDLYITTTLYGIKPGLPYGASLQCIEGEAASEAPSCSPGELVGPTADGVMASMFWVPTNLTSGRKMPGYDYNASWFCTADCPPGWPGWRWDQGRGASLGRAYNYAHVSSVYLGMYLAAANYDALNTTKPARWYLTRAYRTIVAMYKLASWYVHEGLMDGTNFRTVLLALRDEGMMAEAATVEGIMRNRTLVGVENGCRYYVPPGRPPVDRGASYPGCHWYLEANITTAWALQTGLPGAGSEFAWDTTGQEEAFVWGDWFSNESRAAATLAASALDQILAYTPLVPNWAWHGSAYGMGDFGNNGFYRGSGRVLQHYRSGLNSIPSTEAFLADPADLYLLRLAAGSIGGVLTNIDGSGANAMAFHGDPHELFFDPASGDWGLALYGHTHTTASFLVRHDDFGFLCYFCDVDVDVAAGGGSAAGGALLTLTPRDSYRRRVYVAPLGLLIHSDAGVLQRVVCHADVSGGVTAVKIVYAPVGEQPLHHFRLRLATRSGDRVFGLVGNHPISRGSWEISPASAAGPTAVEVTW